MKLLIWNIFKACKTFFAMHLISFLSNFLVFETFRRLSRENSGEVTLSISWRRDWPWKRFRTSRPVFSRYAEADFTDYCLLVATAGMPAGKCARPQYKDSCLDIATVYRASRIATTISNIKLRLMSYGRAQHLHGRRSTTGGQQLTV
jgi:hypothetical protein